ncbi:peptidase S8 [Sesbania bispinosa]|nr:peptidase S8 [Sesbania bispinosa]
MAAAGRSKPRRRAAQKRKVNPSHSHGEHQTSTTKDFNGSRRGVQKRKGKRFSASLALGECFDSEKWESEGAF